MKNYLKKNLTFFIGSLLIIAIIIMSYFCFISTNEQPKNDLVLDDNDLTNMSYTPNNVEDPYCNYIRTLPKASNPSQNYIFEQKLEGNGDIYLKNFFVTALGNYTIAETTCKNGDMQSEKRTIGIANIDNLGKINKVFELPCSYPNYYITSQITPLGIVIASTNEDKSYVYINIIDYTLNSYTTNIISYSEKITIKATIASFLLIAEYPNENIIYSYKDEKLQFSGNTSGQLVDIFEYSNYYIFLLNLPNGWISTKIDKTTLKTQSSCLTSNYSLIGIIPILEENQQKFIILQTNGNVYAQKESDLNAINSTPTNLGNFTVANFMMGEDKLLMVCKGNLNGIVYLNYDLTCEYGDNNAEFFVNNITDNNSLNNTYYYLTISESKELSMLIYKEHQTTQTNIDTCNSNAFLLLQPNKTALIAYQTTNEFHSCINIIGLSI
ncbi:MAG: hypothetical protein WCR54_03560 [Clostridia bacterium]